METKYFENKLGEWTQSFSGFIESEDCDELYKRLKTDSRNKQKILPPSKDTFKAFELCPLSNLKLVVIGQD